MLDPSPHTRSDRSIQKYRDQISMGITLLHILAYLSRQIVYNMFGNCIIDQYNTSLVLQSNLLYCKLQHLGRKLNQPKMLQ